MADIDTRLGVVTELSQTPTRKRIISETSEDAGPSAGATQEYGSEPQSPQVIVSAMHSLGQPRG